MLNRVLASEKAPAGVAESALVWTLPPGTPGAGLRGKSLLSAVRELVLVAQKTLVLMAPFVERRGVGMLLEDLTAALARSVNLVVVAHNLIDIASVESAALEPLRRDAAHLPGRLELFSAVAPAEAPRQDNPLLHAKLVIADDKRALISSANLTVYGLASNFEVGVIITGKQVGTLADAVSTLLEGSLTTRVASV